MSYRVHAYFCSCPQYSVSLLLLMGYSLSWRQTSVLVSKKHNISAVRPTASQYLQTETSKLRITGIF